MCAASRLEPLYAFHSRPIVVVLACLAVFACPGRAADDARHATSAEFALRLYSELHADDGNVVYSPDTLISILAMTAEGARGATALQIRRALGQPRNWRAGSNRLKIAPAPGAAENSGAAKAGVQVRVANALWVQESFPVLPEYVAAMRSRHDALVASCDFRGAPEHAREIINDSVRQATGGAITDVIPPGVVKAQTRVVLVNAIHFKGDWKHAFDPRRTTEAPFYLASGQSQTAQFMNQRRSFRCMQTPELQVLLLPYAGGSFSMMILLPRARDGLPTLERSVSAAKLEQWRHDARRQDAIVTLPRFTLRSQFDLETALRALGIHDAFDPQLADLSGITGTRDLFVSAVVHQAVIDVNESGTEAAASGGVVISQRGLDESLLHIRADHPFLFAVVHEETGRLLFLGRVTQPG